MSINIPEIIYFAFGAATARILLEGIHTQAYSAFDWIKLIFNILRIVILWPLVLFVEKVEAWANPDKKDC